MSQLEDLKAAVAANRSATQSAVTLLNSIPQMIREAAAKDDDGEALEQLATDLSANSAQLAAAVVANTPASVSGATGADTVTVTGSDTLAPAGDTISAVGADTVGAVGTDTVSAVGDDTITGSAAS